MQFTGKITHKSERVTVWKNDTEKVFMVIEEQVDKYPNSIMIDFIGEKVSQTDNFSEWDIVEVEYNTRATEYNGKYYNNVGGWKIKLITKWMSAGEVNTDEALPF